MSLGKHRGHNRPAIAASQLPEAAAGRQRQQLREQRLSLAAQGRSLMLLQRRRQSNHWWRKHRWESLEPTLPRWLVERLQVFRGLILKVDEAVRQLTLRG